MKKVGRYNVISELGRGAMGIVYKASDPTIGREVALKVISLSSSPEEGSNSPQEMFMREVRAAGRLAHPAIVTIHDAFDDQENQTSCIVMEMVPGKTLEKILESGAALASEQVLNIVRQVAEALDYAHRNQVIHRDLKPANILVTEDGRAKITDFGIAKVLAREGVARTVGVMGTPSYMSPEQVKGGELDARTDIFSLGIIIYTMLTGRKPFTGNTAAVMFKIVYEEAPLPSSFDPHLTPAHDYVVQKCLAKDRNKRYASARDLLADLDDLQTGRPLRSQGAAAIPPAAAPADRTVAMSISDLMKATSQQPAQRSAPPAPPAAPPPPVAAPPPPPEAAGQITPPAAEHTVAMSIADLMKAASQQPAQQSAPPAPPAAPPPPAAAPPKPAAPPPSAQAGGPSAPLTTDHTVAMSIADLMKATSQQPAPQSAPLASPSAPAPRATAPPPKPAAPPPPAEVLGSAAPPTAEHTVAMSIADLMKAASQQPAPRSAPPAPPAAPAPRAAAPPKPAAPPPSAEAVGSAAPPTVEHTVAMSIADLMKATSQQPAPQSAPPAPPMAPNQQVAAQPPNPPGSPEATAGPITPAPEDQTLAMPVPRIMSRASQPPQPGVVSAPSPAPPAPAQPPKPAFASPVTSAPDAPPLKGQTLEMHVPDLSTLSPTTPPSPPAAPAPSISDEPTSPMVRTLSMQAPDLSAASPPAPPAAPLMESTIPMRAPDLSAAPPAAGPQPVKAPQPSQSAAAPAVEPARTSGAALPAPKSKLIPAMLGAVAVVLLGGLGLVYWGIHRSGNAPTPPAQVTAQAPPVTPPPAAVQTPVETPASTPPSAATAEKPKPPLSASAGTAKKTGEHKPKMASATHATAPAPPPTQPQPVAVATPPPQPAPPTPSPADIAKAEAAKLARIPRIVRVSCNYGFKEATFTFSSGGQTLLEEPVKGAKKKGAFLGIKGSYQGTFSRTITVPAGASLVTIHVSAKEGSTDLSKDIKMPAPGGFVPTLAVEVDREHLSLNWQSSN